MTLLLWLMKLCFGSRKLKIDEVEGVFKRASRDDFGLRHAGILKGTHQNNNHKEFCNQPVNAIIECDSSN